jgi:hypothetical protein
VAVLKQQQKAWKLVGSNPGKKIQQNEIRSTQNGNNNKKNKIPKMSAQGRKTKKKHEIAVRSMKQKSEKEKKNPPIETNF